MSEPGFSSRLWGPLSLRRVLTLVAPTWTWGAWISTRWTLPGPGVVLAVGGFIALAGAAVVGPRIGKFNADGSANAMPGHNLTYVIIGTFILFFGWFGFNAGSTLAATELRIYHRHQHPVGRKLLERWWPSITLSTALARPMCGWLVTAPWLG